MSGEGRKKSRQLVVQDLRLDQAIKAQDLRNSKGLKTSGRGGAAALQASRQPSKMQSQAASSKDGYNYVVTSFDAEKTLREERKRQRLEEIRKLRFRRNTATPSILSRFQTAQEMNRAFE